MARAEADAIPMTVLGGYLGAGKTTLLNAVLSGTDDARIVVVVNDFGAVNVDADLVRSRGETLELSNGCVCCSLSDGMGAVVRQVREMRPPPDLVLVEVSGVGDPAAVAAWADHPGFRRGGVVVCADATTVRERARDRWVADTVLRQLAVADVLLLTKLDLLAPDATAEVLAWLEQQAPGTPVETDRDLMVARLRQADRPDRPGRPGGEAAEPLDDTAHRRWSATTEDPVDLDRVLGFLSGLPPEVVRAKGVLRTTAAPGRRTVLQRVGDRLDVTDDGAWDQPVSSLVLVGTRAADPEEQLGAALSAALSALDAGS